ncbi:CBS domain-containing protein [Microvirga lotononidis]|uniref:Putative signal-transduction protein containing cAMP-binding and CBS domains n=1 Tax=Microvirga lotononidis TaxID=864069 RepID=I4Z2X4_9HYPH|nr:CBS domain-containing protein [Microvirga lotononidis]EIM30566.1 putative signal-transduction protein containing cAMP-binding and CBS domains [Microvirga lotononidis]WQO26394.1 CBS domain-containing protein [Microvirga lotononidis]
MIVNRILSIKGRDVATIEPSRSLSEAARVLAERRIGALLIVDGHRPVVGIISERDIVRAVAAQGAKALDEPVSRFMTEKVVTCTGETSINDIMELMTQQKFRHIPVVEGGRLSGIISIGDVVKLRLEEVEAETQAIKEYIATA